MVLFQKCVWRFDPSFNFFFYLQFWSKSDYPSWSSCPFFIKFIKMTKATIVNFFYRSYQVLLTDVVIIPRWAIQAPGSLQCYKVCQWLVIGRWFSPGPPVTFTNKTDRHDVTEISLKVALNTINQTKPRDQCAKYGFIRGEITADVMCYIIRHYRLRYIFNLLSADMSWWTISREVTTRPVFDTSAGGLLVPRLPPDQYSIHLLVDY